MDADKPLELCHDDWPEQIVPGTWHDGIFGMKTTAIVSCPACGKITSLDKYNIAEDGTVTPRFECKMISTGKCQYVDWIKLKGW